MPAVRVLGMLEVAFYAVLEAAVRLLPGRLPTTRPDRLRQTLIELPLDVALVLEQHERPEQPSALEQMLRQSRCACMGEHVFVLYADPRTESIRTRVRTHRRAGKSAVNGLFKRDSRDRGCNRNCMCSRAGSWEC